jgi:hypothetical protein
MSTILNNIDSNSNDYICIEENEYTSDDENKNTINNKNLRKNINELFSNTNNTIESNINNCYPIYSTNPIVQSFIVNPNVQQMIKSTINIYKQLRKKLSHGEHLLNKLHHDIQHKKIPKTLKISLSIQLPDEMNEEKNEINKIIDDAQTNIIDKLYDTRKKYVKLLKDNLIKFDDTYKEELKKYLDLHKQSLPSTLSTKDINETLPYDEIMNTYINYIKQRMAIRINNETIYNLNKKRKTEQAKLYDEQAEEQIKSNPRRHIKQFINEVINEKTKQLQTKLISNNTPTIPSSNNTTNHNKHPHKKQKIQNHFSNNKKYTSTYPTKHKNSNSQLKHPSNKGGNPREPSLTTSSNNKHPSFQRYHKPKKQISLENIRSKNFQPEKH